MQIFEVYNETSIELPSLEVDDPDCLKVASIEIIAKSENQEFRSMISLPEQGKCLDVECRTLKIVPGKKSAIILIEYTVMMDRILPRVEKFTKFTHEAQILIFVPE